jgi:hypothetical protein
MNYLKGALSGAAALTLVLIGPGLVGTLRDIRTEKATGFAVVTGGLTEALFSPIFWVAVFVISGLFWAVSRLDNKFLRIVLFWTPTVLITTVGLAAFALFLYAFLHLPRS